VPARHLHTNGRWTLTHKFAGNLLIKRILIASNCDAATAAGGARQSGVKSSAVLTQTVPQVSHTQRIRRKNERGSSPPLSALVIKLY